MNSLYLKTIIYQDLLHNKPFKLYYNEFIVSFYDFKDFREVMFCYT